MRKFRYLNKEVACLRGIRSYKFKKIFNRKKTEKNGKALRTK